MREINFKEPARPVSEIEVVELERTLEVNLPAAYRRFLLKYNGGETADENSWISIKKAGRSYWLNAEFFYGVRDPELPNYVLASLQEEYKNRIPDGTITIGRDGFGNQILLGVKGNQRGEVFFWDHEDEGFEEPEDWYHNVNLIADSFEEFLETLGPLESPDDGTA